LKLSQSGNERMAQPNESNDTARVKESENIEGRGREDLKGRSSDDTKVKWTCCDDSIDGDVAVVIYPSPAHISRHSPSIRCGVPPYLHLQESLDV
jgi:hypothetical protein